MKRSRLALFVASSTVVMLLLGGGLGLGVAADNTYRQVVVFTDVLASVMDYYVDPVETSRLLEGAFEGMLGGLDPLGAYLTPSEVARWRNPADGESNPGITALRALGALQVVTVDPGSPAERAGLVAGDQIRSIDGIPLRDLSYDQALKLLYGPKGSKVRLGLLHPRQGFDREEVELERVQRSVAAYDVKVDRAVVVLTVVDIKRIAADALRDDLASARTSETSGLLIDLRNVVERDTRAAMEFAGMFAGSGTELRLRHRRGGVVETLETGSGNPLWKAGRIAVLVNGATAGGAEAVARTLQEKLGATVYGEETYGLGAEPELFVLPDGSGVLLSTATWETAAGEGWNQDGIDPDEQISVEGRTFEDAYREQLDRAVDAFQERGRA